MTDENVAGVLHRAEATLRNARIALTDVEHPHPERRAAALRNVIVWCRAVTPIIQQLSSRAPGFDEWYAPWQAEMMADPLLKYLYDLRNAILKKGADPPLSRSVYIEHFSTDDIPPAPPGARSFFIGDQLGGNGWEVELADGSIEKIYIALPPGQVQSWATMHEAPDEHLGQPLTDKSPENICRLYLEYLTRLVRDARRRFTDQSVA